MRLHAPSFALLLACGWGAYTPLTGQRILDIGDELRCAGCEIAVLNDVTLTPDVTQAALVRRPIPSVAELDDGRFVAAPMVGDYRLATFSAEGKFLRALGREGEGPGEFAGHRANIRLRVTGSGALHIAQRNRWITLDLLDEYEVTDDVRMEVMAGDAVPIRDELIVHAAVFGTGGTVTPLQVVDRSGRAIRGIGASDSDEARMSPFEAFRWLAPSSDGSAFWSAALNRYEIARLSPTGRQEVLVHRRSEWFAPYFDIMPGELLQVPQRPRVQAVHQDEAGLLWVAITYGEPSFAPVALSDVGGGEAMVLEDYDLNELLDTTIEVIDLESQAVLARRTFDEMLQFVSTNGEAKAYSVVTDDVGDAALRIITLSLEMPDRVP